MATTWNDLKKYGAHESTAMGTIIPNNYLYISHLDEDSQFWILPNTPDTITDTMISNFQGTNALGRSAPVYTYSNSGPRTVQINLKLHRDMLDDANIGISNTGDGKNLGHDYMDSLIRALQAIALPKYNLNNKAVEPPLIAIRIENQIFVKGVLGGPIGISYGLPIQADGKYAVVSLQLSINEVDPYDATTVYKNGGFRGMVQTLRRGMGLEED